jgi:hypothetical protein
MSAYVVESDVPVPEYHCRGVYPFSSMTVGDSFAFPGSKAELVRVAAWHFGRRHKRRFTVRKTSKGFRCWRVA